QTGRAALTVDPCSLATPEDVAAYADSIGGDYQVVGLPVDAPGPVVAGSREPDDRYERVCHWTFDMSTGGDFPATSDDNTVEIRIERLDAADASVSDREQPLCRMFSTGSRPVPLEGLGDHAEATDGFGITCAGDVVI